MNNHFAQALDSRDRLIFKAGPYESAEAAREVAEDIAGTWAGPAYAEVDALPGHHYPTRAAMGQTLINRALATEADGTVTYDSAALDFEALVG